MCVCLFVCVCVCRERERERADLAARFTYIYAYAYVYIYVYIHTCIYIHINIAHPRKETMAACIPISGCTYVQERDTGSNADVELYIYATCRDVRATCKYVYVHICIWM
jgi:hypothetical protein